MAYKRRIIIIQDAKKVAAENALRVAGFGTGFFSIPCNASGRLVNPITHWACDVQLSSSAFERLLSVLGTISGLNQKMYRQGRSVYEADRIGAALAKEGLKHRSRP